ncbi:Mrp/NBP35 family ATP-binding protein [Oscillospiraceae bacterium HV4-5-C5C]|nr:Mrp/NBP35 family ATP-binding protein [Oscillospiraceae bacterium HV4-5-C5C]
MDHAFPKFELNPASHIRHVVAVASGKGGVGKSFVTTALAVMLQRQGLRTAILDADMTGPSIPQALGLTKVSGMADKLIQPAVTATGIQVMSVNLMLKDPTAPVVWRGPMITGAIQQFWSEVWWDKVDIMLIDMPPGTGDVPLTVFQSLPVDGLIMVATPQDLVSMIVAKAAKMASVMKVPLLGLVENMSYFSCPHCGEKSYPFGEGKTAAAAQKLGTQLLDELPLNSAYAGLADAGRVEYLPEPVLQGAVQAITRGFTWT